MLFPVTCSEKLGTEGRKKILFYQNILFSYTEIFNPISNCATPKKVSLIYYGDKMFFFIPFFLVSKPVPILKSENEIAHQSDFSIQNDRHESRVCFHSSTTAQHLRLRHSTWLVGVAGTKNAIIAIALHGKNNTLGTVWNRKEILYC